MVLFVKCHCGHKVRILNQVESGNTSTDWERTYIDIMGCFSVGLCLTVRQKKQNMSVRAALFGIQLLLCCFYKRIQKDGNLEQAQSA